MLNINSVSEIVSELAEAPLWHAETSSVIWTDIPSQSIHIVGLKSRVSSSIRTPIMMGAVGLSPNNELIAATKNGFARITFDGNFESVADFLEPDLRMSDGKVDPPNRFWARNLAPIRSSSWVGHVQANMKLERARSNRLRRKLGLKPLLSCALSKWRSIPRGYLTQAKSFPAYSNFLTETLDASEKETYYPDLYTSWNTNGAWGVPTARAKSDHNP